MDKKCKKCGCQIYDPFGGKIKLHDEDKCAGIIIIDNNYHLCKASKENLLDNNKEDKCPCDNGAAIVKEHLEGCKYFSPSPQSKREGCKQCINYFQNLGVLPTNIVLGSQENCVLHKNSPQSPVSDRTQAFGKNKGGSPIPYSDFQMTKVEKQSPVSEEYIATDFMRSIDGTIEEYKIERLVNLLRKQRQEAYEEGLKERCQNMLSKEETYLKAQHELAEEIMDYMENGLDEPTDWYVSVKNFLLSRGLLPKITE